MKLRMRLYSSKLKKILWIVRFRYLKHKAMRLHRRYDEQFFIVKVGGRITLMGKSGLKSLRQNKIIPLNFTATNLKNMSLFYTPGRYDKKRVPRASGKV